MQNADGKGDGSSNDGTTTKGALKSKNELLEGLHKVLNFNAAMTMNLLQKPNVVVPGQPSKYDMLLLQMAANQVSIINVQHELLLQLSEISDVLSMASAQDTFGGH
jgi:hypothetical protein